MGECLHCGQDAGFLRRRHPECKADHRKGMADIQNTISSAVEGTSVEAISELVMAATREGRIQAHERTRALAQGWEAAVERAFEDSVLSREEQAALDQIAEHFELPLDLLDQNGAWTRASRGMLLREILEGNIPEVQVEGHMPFNFQKSEKLVYAFPDVDYHEQRKRREFRGRSTGVSVRVAKGVYFRTGGFRGHPVVHTEDVYVDSGVLAFTTKHLYFSSPSKRFRIRYDKIVAFEPYEDGIGVQRDAASAKPQTFITGDGWFTYNLVANLARMEI